MFPSHRAATADHLERFFMEVVSSGRTEILLCGYVVAFGDKYLVIIQKQQLVLGGVVCHSRIISTFRFVIGGRRTGPNMFQMFFRNGAMEQLKISQGTEGLKISRVSSQKLGINSRTHLTYCLSKANPVLVGTSNGDIIRASGHVGFKKRGSSVPVIQITATGKQTLLALFKDGRLELIDVNTKKCVTFLEGRYTAMEQIWKSDARGTIIVGDMDGSLHAIDIKDRKLTHMMVQKQMHKERISCLFRLKDDYVAVGTTTGGFRLLNRDRFLPSTIAPTIFSSPALQGVSCVPTSQFYVTINNDQLVSIPKNPGQAGLKGKVGNVVEFSAPKLRMAYFMNQNREIVCAYSGLQVYVRMTEFRKHAMTNFTTIKNSEIGRSFTKAVKNITAVIVQEDFLFVQCDSDEIVVFEFDFYGTDLVKLCSFIHPIEGVKSRITAGSVIQYGPGNTEYIVIIGFLGGYTGGYKGDAQQKETRLNSVPVELNNSFICDSVVTKAKLVERSRKVEYASSPYITLLTAKGLCIKVTPHKFLKREGQLLQFPKGIVPVREWFLGTVIGGKGRIIDMGGEIVVAGFKQSTLSVFSLFSNEVLASVETAGSSKPFSVIKILNIVSLTHTIPKSSKLVTQTIVAEMPMPLYNMVDSAPINCLLAIRHPADDASFFLAGDTNGLLSVNALSPIPGCPIMRYTDFQLDGAVTCIEQQEKELIYVGTSTGMIYRFERFGAGAEMSKCVLSQVVSPPVSIFLHPYPNIRLLLFCKHGAVMYNINCGFFPVAKFPCMLKSGIEYTDRKHNYMIFGISQENDLHRIGPYFDNPKRAGPAQKKVLGMKVTRFMMERTGVGCQTYDRIIAGDTKGWMYYMCYDVNAKRCSCAFADRYHSHEIKEIKQLFVDVSDEEHRHYIITMDVIRFVVIREYLSLMKAPFAKLNKEPTTYQSSVPSLRCMEFIFQEGKVLVGGRGLSFHDLNITKTRRI